MVDLLRGASARSLAERIAPELCSLTSDDDVETLAAVLNELGQEQLKDLLEDIQNRS